MYQALKYYFISLLVCLVMGSDSLPQNIIEWCCVIWMLTLSGSLTVNSVHGHGSYHNSILNTPLTLSGADMYFFIYWGYGFIT